MKLVTIMRGIPGSGKSTYTKQFPNAVICSADHYFEKDGEYRFDKNKLGVAHHQCKMRFHAALIDGEEHVIVDNTNMTLREMEDYIMEAKFFGYPVEFVEVECPVEIAHARNAHGVPLEAVKRMAARFQPLYSVSTGNTLKRISGVAK